MVIVRKTWIDDDGSGLTGTPINNAALQGDIYDPIDAAIAAAVVPPPSPVWQTYAYNAANLSAATGVFTVHPLGWFFQYVVIGKIGLVNVFHNTATTTAATAWVAIAWPPGFVVAGSGNLLGSINMGGTLVPTTCFVSAPNGLRFYPSVALTGTIPALAGTLSMNASLILALA